MMLMFDINADFVMQVKEFVIQTHHLSAKAIKIIEET